jgi:hypothetical protein
MFAERQFARKSFAGTRFEIRLLARRFLLAELCPRLSDYGGTGISRVQPGEDSRRSIGLLSFVVVYLWPLCRQETAVDCRNSLGAR